ncbi:MAG TPA: terminase family protein [Vicinamibacterales bacterium]|nr:terminase family protein [Vicinamibacterales bacterium]
MIAALERLARGEIRRLMVLMPPGSAKSTYVSVLFPPWLLAQNPQASIIAASHTAELAERFGRKVRNIIQEHAPTLGYGIRVDSAAAGRWDTDAGGEYFAAGVMGPITGRRADLAVIDDPVKSRQDADSEVIRDRTWEWWRNDLFTRLKPDARVVLVMTRWHEDDLGGRLLADMESGGPKWEVLKLPMEAESNDPLGRKVGEPLWPEWFNDEMRAEAKRDQRTWSALYQQRPAPDEGTFFQKAWFRSWVDKPKGLNVYGSSDYAVTDGDGDWTVHRVWGVSPDGDLYRLAGWRGQTTSDVWIEQLLDLIKAHKPLCWFGEAGVIAKAVEPAIKRRMRERSVFCRMEWLPSIHDKPTRARGFQARAASSRVWFEQGADLTEFLQFPAGKHDDEVDTASLIGRALDEAHPGIVPPQEKKATKRDPWGDDEDTDGTTWRSA